MSRSLRIAIANWTGRMAGGAEQYIRDCAPELRRQGHEVALVHECDRPEDRELILDGTGIRSWSVARDGREEVIRRLREWGPDVLFVQGLLDPSFEETMLGIAPAVLLAHSYYGTCVSGEKLWKSSERACSKPFGPSCLLHYYPHRCGGLNPLTMIRQYRLQGRRNGLLPKYSSVVALSRHMRDEMSRAGGRSVHVPLLQSGRSFEPPAAGGDLSIWRLLFVGRMTRLKGGELLLDALPILRGLAARPIEAAFVGDGPDRERWESTAEKLMRDDSSLRIRFTGWLVGEALDRQWRSADLFVIPSTWPEPLGLAGSDAARHALPSVGFRVGGIPDWLIDGTNGCLASADPPTAAKLAAAISRALDPERHAELRASTARHGLHVAVNNHVGALQQILAEAAEAPAR